MNQFIKTWIRWLFGCLIFFQISCNTKQQYNSFTVSLQDSLDLQVKYQRAHVSISQVQKIIRNGDLVTRTGNDFTSESLRSLNQRNKTYSHCGIASLENDTVFIYHALGGDFNPDQKIRRDPFEIFAEPYSNRGIAVFRFNLSETTRNEFKRNAIGFYNKQVMFDMDFDLKTDDRMYCAEFVLKCFINCTYSSLSFKHSWIGSFEFIGVDDLFLHPLCKLQFQIIYK